jgi:hypothetical protein
VIEDVTAAASVDAKLQMLYEQYGGKKD